MADSTWKVVCGLADGGTEEYLISGRPNLDEHWAMLLIRSNGSSIISAAFPTKNVIAMVMVDKGLG